MRRLEVVFRDSFDAPLPAARGYLEIAENRSLEEYFSGEPISFVITTLMSDLPLHANMDCIIGDKENERYYKCHIIEMNKDSGLLRVMSEVYKD